MKIDNYSKLYIFFKFCKDKEIHKLISCLKYTDSPAYFSKIFNRIFYKDLGLYLDLFYYKDFILYYIIFHNKSQYMILLLYYISHFIGFLNILYFVISFHNKLYHN